MKERMKRSKPVGVNADDFLVMEITPQDRVAFKKDNREIVLWNSNEPNNPLRLEIDGGKITDIKFQVSAAILQVEP